MSVVQSLVTATRRRQRGLVSQVKRTRPLDWRDVGEAPAYPVYLLPPSEQFRNRHSTFEEQVAHADELLTVVEERLPKYTRLPRQIPLYRTGDDLRSSEDTFFEVSLKPLRTGADSVYQLPRDAPVIPIVNITDTALAAQYGYYVDLGLYRSWSEVDDDVDSEGFIDLELPKRRAEAVEDALRVLAAADASQAQPIVLGNFGRTFLLGPRAQELLIRVN